MEGGVSLPLTPSCPWKNGDEIALPPTGLSGAWRERRESVNHTERTSLRTTQAGSTETFYWESGFWRLEDPWECPGQEEPLPPVKECPSLSQDTCGPSEIQLESIQHLLLKDHSGQWIIRVFSVCDAVLNSFAFIQTLERCAISISPFQMKMLREGK